MLRTVATTMLCLCVVGVLVLAIVLAVDYCERQWGRGGFLAGHEVSTLTDDQIVWPAPTPFMVEAAAVSDSIPEWEVTECGVGESSCELLGKAVSSWGHASLGLERERERERELT